MVFVCFVQKCNILTRASQGLAHKRQYDCVEAIVAHGQVQQVVQLNSMQTWI